MFTRETIESVRALTARVTGRLYPGVIDAQQGEGLCVCGDAARAQIAACSVPALARGVMLLTKALHEGKDRLDLRQERLFDSCGVQLDVSRNAVMTVDGVKRYIDVCAALGMNLVLLYAEDVFPVPEYPHFGYLRGRYSAQELSEMDAYAQSLGVELVMSIQTLAHLEQFLQWHTVEHLRDTESCLMADDEETYAFIEAVIRSLRACLRSTRLHIGMDEAHGVGLARYYARHGATDRFELLSRHLARVVAICEKYDFRPMMWSDMFFRLGSKDNEYYDLDADIPQSVLDSLPPVDMVYWDYYHKDELTYDRMLEEHARMGEETIFAGGIWTWSGFLPQVDFTRATMEPALRMCAKHRVKTVMATMWGDDGAETSHFLALSQLPVFSEFCWQGERCRYEDVESVGEFISGLPKEAYRAFSLFYPGAQDLRPGKQLLYCDLLYPLGPDKEEIEASVSRSREALSILAPYAALAECRYAIALFEVCLAKGLLLLELRSRYQAGDRAWIAQAAGEAIPALIAAYRTLCAQHKALWERDYKRNGWEVMALRYGAVIGRLEDVQDALARWAGGALDTLSEMDEPVLDPTRWRGMRQYSTLISPMYEI